MTVEEFYGWGVPTVLGIAGLVFIVLMLINAPYGRHWRTGWGPSIPARVGWLVMEVPSPACFLLAYFNGDHAFEPIPLFFMALFQGHYIHRTLIFPMLMRGSANKRNALFIVVVAMVFNACNGALCGLAVGHFNAYETSWLWDPRFIVGMLLFGVGLVINLHSDAILRNLRKPGETGYKIPHGGLYRWISSPNYLGEIIEWLGWAIATWTGAGFAFAAFTFANLAPRARANQDWYLERFEDYPEERRRLIPGVW